MNSAKNCWIFNLYHCQEVKACRLENTVLGVSGGLDSTLTLIAIVKAMDKLQYPRKHHCHNHAGFGTTDRTYDNAVALIKAFGADFREISITEACLQYFKDIHMTRAYTMLLMKMPSPRTHPNIDGHSQ